MQENIFVIQEGSFKMKFQKHAAAAAAKSLQSCPTLCGHRVLHRRQPTRLLCPWDSPGKNTGVGCHFLPNAWKWRCSVVSNSSRPHGLQPTRLLRPWDFPGKSTGVGCHCLLLQKHSHRQNFMNLITSQLRISNQQKIPWTALCRIYCENEDHSQQPDCRHPRKCRH